MGFVDYVLLYYKNVHNKEVKINDYPGYLKKFMFRNISVETFKNAINISKTKNIFIKPCGNIKKFVGCVIPSSKVTYGWNKHVFVSDIVKFVSEFRFFIIDNKIRCSSYYSGNISMIPDNNDVIEMVSLLENNNEIEGGNYLIDVGVLETGETCFIEINHGFSFGMYDADVTICIELMIKANSSFIFNI